MKFIEEIIVVTAICKYNQHNYPNQYKLLHVLLIKLLKLDVSLLLKKLNN